MSLPLDLMQLRAARPAFYAAFDALGKAGAVEIEFLWPAVHLLAEAASADGYVIDDADLIGMGALIGVLRVRYPSVEATINAMIAVSARAHAEGRPISPGDFGGDLPQRFDELIGIASRAACDAAAELDLYR